MGVALAQEVLDLTADLLAGPWARSGGNRAGPAIGVNATGKRLRRPLGGFSGVHDCCRSKLAVHGKAAEG